MRKHTSANEIIEKQLDNHVDSLEKVVDADVLAYLGPITDGVDDAVRDAIESRPKKRPKLFLVLETKGGFIEVAQRIADTLRAHYGEVEFIIPGHAMSAGTVLVMSGDAIWMDYYSILGPIDPQVQRPDGTLIPAIGYLIQYERLISKDKKGTLTTAELAILVKKFDLAELYYYEQARDLSIELLKQWLAKYKFKNWTMTQTQGKKVTNRMRIRRASEIAAALSDPQRWLSHSRGISMEVLRRELNLQIEDFGANTALSGAIKLYYKLLKDFMMRLGHEAVLHRSGRYVPLREG